MSVHIPYLVMEGETGLVTNGTTLQFNVKGSQTLRVIRSHLLVGRQSLFPPR